MENSSIYSVPAQDPPLNQSVTPPLQSGGDMLGKKLPGPTAILGQAWQVYKDRFWLLVGIYLVPSAVFVVYIACVSGGLIAGSALTSKFAGSFGATLIAGLILAVLIYIAIIYIGIWSQAALIYVIKGADQRLGFKESFGQASHKIGSFFGASLLAGLAIAGMALLLEIPGFMFLYGPLLRWLLPMVSSIWIIFALMGLLGLVLAIPAIIVAVKYSLATFIVVGDNTTAMPAIKRSSDYVHGYWWPVFWRFVFIGMVAILVSIPIFLFTSFLGNFFEKTIAGVAGIIVVAIINIVFSVILPPLYVIYGYKVYENLRGIKGESQIPADKSSGLWAIIGGVLAIIVIVGGLFVWSALNSARAKSRDAKRLADVRQLSSAFELYFNDHQTYPSKLSELTKSSSLASAVMSAVPVAPNPEDGTCSKMENSYQYKLVDSSHYELTFCLGSITGGYFAGMHTMTESGIDKESRTNLPSESFKYPPPSQNQNSPSETQTTSIPSSFTFSNINLPSARVGVSYGGSVDFSPCDSYDGYTTSTNLPPGLSRGGPATLRAATGNPSDPTDICRIFLVGTPTKPGNFTFEITLDAGNSNKTQSFNLQVNK
jgi:hypothetical protein